jgi:hypothetical protein
MFISLVFITGCDSATLERIDDIESDIESIEEYDDTDLRSTIADLQDALDALEDYDDTALLNTISELESEIDDLQAEIGLMEDYDDTALLATIANLENEVSLLEASIGPVFNNIPRDQIIERYDQLNLLSLGLTANDNIDGDLTNSITVNISSTFGLTVGNHAVTYSVTDSDGNTRSETINLTVSETHWLFTYDVINDNSEIMITGAKSDVYTQITIPDSIGGLPVTTIGMYALAYLNLYNVTFSENIVEIRDGAFTGNNLDSITLPSSLEIIGPAAFQWNQIVGITIPERVSSIGNHAFRGDTLIDYYVSPDNPYFSAKWGILYNKDQTILLSYPMGRTNLFYTMPEGVIEIGEGAFESRLLESVLLPTTLEIIGPRAFYNCELNNLVIPSGVTTIGYSAFGSNNLTSITIPESVVSIGNQAFGNNSFSSVIIEGYETRFNDTWITIGFPEELMP